MNNLKERCRNHPELNQTFCMTVNGKKKQTVFLFVFSLEDLSKCL